MATSDNKVIVSLDPKAVHLLERIAKGLEAQTPKSRVKITNYPNVSSSAAMQKAVDTIYYETGHTQGSCADLVQKMNRAGIVMTLKED